LSEDKLITLVFLRMTVQLFSFRTQDAQQCKSAFDENGSLGVCCAGVSSHHFRVRALPISAAASCFCITMLQRRKAPGEKQ